MFRISQAKKTVAVAPRERRQKAVEGKKEGRKTMIDDAEDLNASMSTNVGIGSVVVNDYSSTGGGDNDATMILVTQPSSSLCELLCVREERRTKFWSRKILLVTPH